MLQDWLVGSEKSHNEQISNISTDCPPQYLGVQVHFQAFCFPQARHLRGGEAAWWVSILICLQFMMSSCLFADNFDMNAAESLGVGVDPKSGLEGLLGKAILPVEQLKEDRGRRIRR